MSQPAPIPLRATSRPVRDPDRREHRLLRRVLLISSSVAVLGLGCAIFAEVAAATGGWLVRGDGLAYYMTARSLVIDRDTDLSDEYAALDARLPAGSPVLTAVRSSARRDPPGGQRGRNGRMAGIARIALPWPIGTGLAMAPFFALGYGVESLLAALDGHVPDSYGLVPQLFYGLGALLYGLLGGWATYFCCRRVAGPEIAALATLGVILGGPLLFYLFFHPSMSHAPSFALVALLALRWWQHFDTIGRDAPAGAPDSERPESAESPGSAESAGSAGVNGVAVARGGEAGRPAKVLRPRISRWVAKPAATPELRAALELGLLFGLLVLVRYQNLTYGLLPLAYLWRLARVRQPAAVLRAATLLAGAAGAVIALQALHLLRNGAGGIGGVMAAGSVEGSGLALAQNTFDFASPNFGRVLASCQHGAFYWTPVLALGFAGLLWAAWRRPWARVFLAVFLANVYLIGCLAGGTNWSGDHAFGMRYLSDCAPLLAAGLAVGLAAVVGRLAARRPLPEKVSAAGTRAAAVLVTLLAAGNALLVLAFSTGRIDREGCVTYPRMAAAIGGLLAGHARGAATPALPAPALPLPGDDR